MTTFCQKSDNFVAKGCNIQRVDTNCKRRHTLLSKLLYRKLQTCSFRLLELYYRTALKKGKFPVCFHDHLFYVQNHISSDLYILFLKLTFLSLFFLLSCFWLLFLLPLPTGHPPLSSTLFYIYILMIYTLRYASLSPLSLNFLLPVPPF